MSTPTTRLAGEVYRELRALWTHLYGGHRAPRPAEAHERLRHLLQDVGRVSMGQAASIQEARKQRGD